MTEVNRQYVACAFVTDGRRYTYHYDGEQPLKEGEQVIVDTKHGEATIAVVGIVETPPPFDTKPVKGRAPAVEQETA